MTSTKLAENCSLELLEKNTPDQSDVCRNGRDNQKQIYSPKKPIIGSGRCHRTRPFLPNPSVTASVAATVVPGTAYLQFHKAGIGVCPEIGSGFPL